MNRWLSRALWPAAAVVLYLVLQFLCGSAAVLVTSISNEVISVASWGLSLAVIVSAVVTSAVVLCMPGWGLRGAYKRVGCGAGAGAAAVLACLGCMFAFNMICEFMSLPDMMAETFVDMSKTWVGVLSLAVAGPVCEEIVCRGGMMEPLLRRGVHGWVAVGVSALVFGLIHGNPAQIPFACLVGVVFGVVYWRTRSLVLTTVCHIINNSVSVWQMRVWGEQSAEMTFRTLWGDWACVGIIVAVLIVSGVLLWLFWKNSDGMKNEE